MRSKLSGTLLAVALAACGDSTGPENFDPIQSEQTAQAVFGSVGSNPALASLAILSGAFNFSAGQAAVSVAAAAVPDEAVPVTHAARVRALSRAALAFSAASPQDLFPPSVQGNTYIYNPETETYEVDPARTGAPATGVRFVLYAVDPILRQVVLPLQEIGHVDLIDESTATANRLHLVAVVGQLTALDYVASAQLGGGGATFSAEGFLSDGSATVNFTLTFSASASGISLDYRIEVAGGDQSIRLVATGDPEAESLSITLTIEGGGDRVVLTVTIAPDSIEGSITYNGDVVVTFSGSEDEITFTRPGAAELTDADRDALEELADLVDEVFDSFEELFDPAFLVFGFSG